MNKQSIDGTSHISQRLAQIRQEEKHKQVKPKWVKSKKLVDWTVRFVAGIAIYTLAIAMVFTLLNRLGWRHEVTLGAAAGLIGFLYWVNKER